MGRRRDNSIDLLPDDLRAMVRAMLAGKNPRFTYEQIIEAVRQKSEGEHDVTLSSLSRYWKNVYELELAEATRRTKFSVSLAKKVTEAAKVNSDNPKAMEGLILSVIDGAFLANETDPAAVDPADLLQAKAALLRVQNERAKIAIREKELKAQLEKFRLEKEKLERALAKQKAEDARKRKEAEKALHAAEKTGDGERMKQAIHKVQAIYGVQTGAA